MIIIGGEPTPISGTEPGYGGLLVSLNNLRMKMERQAENADGEVKQSLTYLNQSVDKFIVAINTPVDNHIGKTGITHGETIETVQLEKVDNYRTALLEEHVAGEVDAFCTPKGVTHAVLNSINGIDLTEYQYNNFIPFSLIHHVDQFKRVAIDNGLSRYFKEAPATVIMNGDRVIVSPQYVDNSAAPYSMFYSESVQALTGLNLNEERQTATYYTGTGWNMKGALTKDGQIGIFRPLANKGIYDYTNALPGAGNRYVVLSSVFGDITHKGCLISAEWVNGQINLGHYFFGVNDPDNNPTLTQIVTDTYKATYNTVNAINVTDSLNKTRVLKLTDFMSLGSGVKVESDLKAGEHPTITADWRYQNTEFLMNISLPVKVTIGNKVFKKIFTFTESVRPGKLVVVDTGSITLLKGVTKDTIMNEADLDNSKWLVDNDIFNVLNLVQCPGVINANGLIVTAKTTRSSLRMKIMASAIKGVIPLLENPGLHLPLSESVTHTFVPTRHFSFGDLSERTFPVSQDDAKTIYLTYALAADKLGYSYKELAWDTGTIATLNGTNYSVIRPNRITEKDLTRYVPNSVMSMSQPTGGVSLNGMCFTDATNFIGCDGLQYINGTMTTGNNITLSPLSLIVLNSHKSLVMAKAVQSPVYNGNISDYPIKPSMGVFGLGSGKALVYWTDGVSYVEACVTTLTSANGIVTLGLKTDTVRYVVSQNTTANKGYRRSVSGDDLQLAHSDLLAYKTSNNAIRFVLNRPFGELAGDVSFTTANFAAEVTTLVPEKTNPAETYDNLTAFDIAKERYPACLIPKVGLFQTIPVNTTANTLVRIGGAETFDPYLWSAGKVIIIPEGSRCVLNGVGIAIDETLEQPYTTTPAYFYIEQEGSSIRLVQYASQQNPKGNAVLAGYDNDGTGIRYTRSYIVLDGHLISTERKGNTIPMVADDNTELGSSNFFRYNDVIRDN